MTTVMLSNGVEMPALGFGVFQTPPIPKSVTPARIRENFDVFDFALTEDELTRLDALDTGVCGGPEPEAITLETFGREISEE